MHLSSFQLNCFAKMFDLPDLLKQLNSSTFNTDSVLIENKAVGLMPPTSIHSGGSTPLASISPPATIINSTLPNTINTPLIPQLMNPALCAGESQIWF